MTNFQAERVDESQSKVDRRKRGRFVYPFLRVFKGTDNILCTKWYRKPICSNKFINLFKMKVNFKFDQWNIKHFTELLCTSKFVSKNCLKTNKYQSIIRHYLY